MNLTTKKLSFCDVIKMKINIKKYLSILTSLLFLFVGSMSTFAEYREPQPGLKTVKNLLATAVLPIGKTMYIWGGGWNKADTGSGEGSTHIGLMPQWERFARQQHADYDFHNFEYQINDGLDCSGFVGWALYNIFNTEEGHNGFVMSATKMAREFANSGFGSFNDASDVIDYKPGDIMSGPGHVWICIGQCADGSVVFVHSSPCGVQINGTTTLDGNEESMAIKLAARYMNKYFPEWAEKYPKFSRDCSYLTQYSQMRWTVDGTGVLADPDGYLEKSVEEILADLFGEIS